MKIDIRPGEEKLGQAFELIGALQQLVAALSQRVEVDAMVISLLLDQIEDPQAALRNWRARIAAYYPERALEHLGREDATYSSVELNQRIERWTRAFESRARRRPTDE